MQNNRTVIMLVGTPGQGKTTFINDPDNQNAITVKYGVEFNVSSDAPIEDIAMYTGKTYSEVFQQVIDSANKYVEVMVSLLSLGERSFIIDRTSLTKKSRANMLNRIAGKEHYNKIAVVFDEVDKIEQLRRLDERGKTEGKVISAKLLEEMQGRFEYPELSEGFDEVMTVQQFFNTLPKIEDNQIYGETKFG